MAVLDESVADAGAVRPLAWSCDPGRVLASWPRSCPLAALVSGEAAQGPASRSRWSILARPVRTVRPPLDDATPGETLARLRDTLAATRVPTLDTSEIPFRGGWIACLGYELGGALEPRTRRERAGRGKSADADRPPAGGVIELQRCPGAYVHDRATGRWWAVGDVSALPELDPDGGAMPEAAGFDVARPRSDMGAAGYRAAVAQAVEYVHAGDVFQVNIAHTLAAEFRGCPRGLFLRALRGARPWYGAYLEPAPGRAICSMSPELYLEHDARTGRVVTRPIKGTRPGDAPASELLRSEKDEAELVMIVDLMRNDLGRVCRVGSVRVADARSIERHGGVGGTDGAGVRHGVATVEGVLRDGLDVADLIGATFPAGSITGAPKVRAMQIINELEPGPRGAYCGAIGSFSDCGRTALSVAIRTATVEGDACGPHGEIRGVVRYPVGAGVVAESDPEAEWRETLDKARTFFGAVSEGAWTDG